MEAQAPEPLLDRMQRKKTRAIAELFAIPVREANAFDDIEGMLRRMYALHDVALKPLNRYNRLTGVYETLKQTSIPITIPRNPNGMPRVFAIMRDNMEMYHTVEPGIGREHVYLSKFTLVAEMLVSRARKHLTSKL